MAHQRGLGTLQDIQMGFPWYTAKHSIFVLHICNAFFVPFYVLIICYHMDFNWGPVYFQLISHVLVSYEVRLMTTPTRIITLWNLLDQHEKYEALGTGINRSDAHCHVLDSVKIECNANIACVTET